MANEDKKKGYEHAVPEVPLDPDFPKNFKAHCIMSLDELNKTLENVLKTGRPISFDLETNSLDPDREDTFIVGFSFACSANEGWYVPVKHIDFGLGNEAVESLIKALYKAPLILVYNGKFDIRWLEYKNKADFSKAKMYEVMIGVFNSDTNNKTCGLKWAERHFCGRVPPTFNETVGDAENFYYVTVKEAYFYGALDSGSTYAVAERTLPYYSDAGYSGKLDNAFWYPMAKWEEILHPINIKILEQYQVDTEASLQKTEKEIYAILGKVVKLNSPKQLGDALKDIGINTGKYTPKGQMKTDNPTLEQYSDQCKQRGEKPPEIIAKLISWSKDFKFLDSYILPYIAEAKRMNGYGRFNYYLFGAPTGRTSSGADKKNTYYFHANIQAQGKGHPMDYYVFDDVPDYELQENEHRHMRWIFSPIRQHPVLGTSNKSIEGFNPKLNIRNMCLPPDGIYGDKSAWTLISCDFSAEELKIQANLANETLWIDTFNHGGDLHKSMAVKMWGEANYNKEKRRIAKSINFGFLYGLSAASLQQKFTMTQEEAESTINSYMAGIPNIIRYQQAAVKLAKKQGYIRNAFGRRRWVKFWLKSASPRDRAFGERTVKNNLVQSTAAEVLRIAIVRIWKEIYNNPKYKGDIVFFNTVHDEINFFVKKERAEEFGVLVANTMMLKHPNWKTPLNTSCDLGYTWGSTFPFEFTDETRTHLRPDWKELPPIVEEAVEETPEQIEEPEPEQVPEDEFEL